MPLLFIGTGRQMWMLAQDITVIFHCGLQFNKCEIHTRMQNWDTHIHTHTALLPLLLFLVWLVATAPIQSPTGHPKSSLHPLHDQTHPHSALLMILESIHSSQPLSPLNHTISIPLSGLFQLHTSRHFQQRFMHLRLWKKQGLVFPHSAFDTPEYRTANIF
jgi:hypothetical protein